MIKGKTPEEIRKQFNIVSSFFSAYFKSVSCRIICQFDFLWRTARSKLIGPFFGGSNFCHTPG